MNNSALEILGLFIVLAFATAAISMTTAKSVVFKPLRKRIAVKSKWLGELVRCPYCTSHWVGFVFAFIYKPYFLHSGVPLLDWFVSALALVGAASLFAFVIYKVYAAMHITE